MEKVSERKRKTKGSLSVLDEFTDDAGAIQFTPNLSHEEQQRIDEKTVMADMPASVRLNLESKLSQSGVKVEPLLESKLSQNGVKVEPNKKISISFKEKVEPQPEPLLESKLSQSEVKVEPKESLSSLVGLQRSALFFLFDSCIKEGSRTSSAISISNLSFAMKSTVAAVRKAVQRLEAKGYIVRGQFKDGRGGWTKYELPRPVYSDLLTNQSRAKVEPNLSQSRAKVEPQPEPQPEPSRSSSSSISLYNKTTTTQGAEKFEFKLDQVSEFGLTASAVSRCFELYPNLENEKMQDLLNRFAQFMRSGDGKRVQNARGFFISLAEQMSKGMTPLDHIETPEAILMREIVFKKRAQKAEQELLEKELQDFDFEDWWTELSPQVRDELIPPNNIASPGSSSQKLLAKQVHAEKFWPDRKMRALTENEVSL